MLGSLMGGGFGGSKYRLNFEFRFSMTSTDMLLEKTMSQITTMEMVSSAQKLSLADY